MSASAREVAHDYILKELVGDDGSWSNGHETSYMHADALLAALSAAGFVIVPREIGTGPMYKAAFQALNKRPSDGYEYDSRPKTVWQAAISAAEGKK